MARHNGVNRLSRTLQSGLLCLLFASVAQCQTRSPYLNVDYLPRECHIGVADCKVGLNSTLSGAITVLLLENDSDTKVLTTTANTGFYIFTPSPDLTPGPGYKIRLKQGEAVSESVGDFTILSEPSQQQNTATTTAATSPPTTTSSTISSTPKKPLGTGDKAAIAVGIVLFLVFLASLSAFLILRRKRQKLARMVLDSNTTNHLYNGSSPSLDAEKSMGARRAFAGMPSADSDRYEIQSPVSAICEVASPALSQSSTVFEQRMGPVEMAARREAVELPTESNERVELWAGR